MIIDATQLGAAPAPLEVNRDALLELARGGSLYSDRFACMRELVQNAVDATLLRLFVERAAAFPTSERSMHDLRAALEPYPIDVAVERLADEGEGDSAVHRYRVVVDDRGIGISLADVPYLQHVGSSQKNPTRAATIAAMPEWMRPSGAFGIGLQSAFLVSDELVLRSRHVDGPAIDVVLRSVDGGTVEVRAGSREEAGTRAELVVRIPARDIEERYVPGQDRILERSVDQSLAAALTLTESIASVAVVPVRVAGRRVATLWAADEAVFDPETLIEIAMPLTDEGAEDVSDPRAAWLESHRSAQRAGAWRIGEKVSGCYRGALVTHYARPIEFPWRYNVHFSSARALLSLNRDGYSTKGGIAVSERLMETVRRLAPRHRERLAAAEVAPNVRAWLSVFGKELGDPAGDDWRRVAMYRRENGTQITLGDLEDFGEIQVVESPPAADGVHVPATHMLPSGERIVGGTPRHALLHVALPGTLIESGWVRRLRSVPGVSVRPEALREWLSSAGTDVQIRPSLPCPDAHTALSFVWKERPDRFESLHFGGWAAPTSMMSPWTFRDGLVDLPEPHRWIGWTANEYGGPPRAVSDVAAALVRFLREFDGDLRENPRLTVKYDLLAAIAEIER